MRREMRSGFSMKIPTRPSPILFSHGLRLAASLVEVIGFAASLVEEIKEIKEIFIPLGEALSAISALSAGLLVSHADSILIVPIFIVPQK